MKKLLALLLTVAMVLSLAACGGGQEPTPTTEAPTTAESTTDAPTTEPTTEVPGKTVMSYQEYMDAKVDDEVTIQATIQLAAYNAEFGNASLFLADEDGAYFVYRMPVEEKDAQLMKEGTVLKITGSKAEWSGEVEIGEGATYEVVSDAAAFVSEAVDITELLGQNELVEHMNKRIRISGVLVAASTDPDGQNVASLYQWNGSGVQGDDVYFIIHTENGMNFSVLVESDEFGADTDVYQAAEKLNIGDTVDLEGFLYWYEGAQPHITSITVTKEGPQPMSAAQFQEAGMDTEVAVAAYVQTRVYNQEEGYVNLFLANEDGAYYVYKMPVSPAESGFIEEGRHMLVWGLKTSWSGEVEIVDGSFLLLNGEMISEAQDITDMLNKEELAETMNARVKISSARVAASLDADNKEQAFLYKWNGSGVDGDDLYFTVTVAGQEYVLTVESDECPAGSEVYEAVKALNIGDAIDLEGFLYWYEGPQPHIYLVKEAEGPQAMSFMEYLAAEMESEVIVDAYVQLMAYNAENGTANLFLADETGGAYYVYQMNLSEEEAQKIEAGKRLLVRGYKGEWAGEVEIKDVESWELLNGEFLSEPQEVSLLLTQPELLAFLQNGRISVKGATVVASLDGEEKEQPFLYKWNGSGEEGDDIYFKLLIGGQVFTFVVESDEFDAESDTYKAAQAMQIGDSVDVNGFLYWYEGPQPHVYEIDGSAYAKQSEEAMSFGRYMGAAVDEAVTVEGFVQLVTAYMEKDGQGMVNLYLHDKVGGYYVYNMPITEEEAAALEPGMAVRIKGFKAEWAQMPEIKDATLEVLESEESYIAEARPGEILFRDVEEYVPEALIASPLALFGMVVEASQNEAGEEVPFLYKWNGSGEEGDDIYFTVSYLGKSLTLVVESEEFDKETDVYKAVQALQIGDVVDVTALLYWYEGPQPHVSGVDASAYTKTEGAINYREYVAAEMEEKVTIDAYIQQMALVENDGKTLLNLFLSDRVGGYYVYGMPLEEQDAETQLSVGDRLLITGFKKEWSGEVEITDVEAWELLEADKYLASPRPMDEKIGDEEANKAIMNQLFSLKEAEVIASELEGKEVPFLYKWNGSGVEGDDIYFKVLAGETELTIVVESDEIPGDSLEYQMIQELHVGDKVDLTAFMYWYEGPQPHLYSIEVIEADIAE